MSQHIYSTDEIRAILNPVFNRHNVKRAVLFGSYAKGTAEPGSDIDIFVDSGLKGLRFYGLLEDVVPALARMLTFLIRRRFCLFRRWLMKFLKVGF